MLDTTSLMSITHKSFSIFPVACPVSISKHKSCSPTEHNVTIASVERGDNTTLTTMRTAAAWLPPNITTGNKGENTEFSHKHNDFITVH